jgi:transposase
MSSPRLKLFAVAEGGVCRYAGFRLTLKIVRRCSRMTKSTRPVALRQIEFLDAEIQAVERLIAAEALKSTETKGLMTVLGVNVICAASFLAAIGDIRRFESSRKLTGYLGLDPRVSQSGTGPATHGRISKQGSMRARHALVEASWSVVSQPGPIRAFYQRIRSRRGHQVAVVAAARKLACPFAAC